MIGWGLSLALAAGACLGGVIGYEIGWRARGRYERPLELDRRPFPDPRDPLHLAMERANQAEPWQPARSFWTPPPAPTPPPGTP